MRRLSSTSDATRIGTGIHCLVRRGATWRVWMNGAQSCRETGKSLSTACTDFGSVRTPPKRSEHVASTRIFCKAVFPHGGPWDFPPNPCRAHRGPRRRRKNRRYSRLGGVRFAAAKTRAGTGPDRLGAMPRWIWRSGPACRKSVWSACVAIPAARNRSRRSARCRRRFPRSSGCRARRRDPRSRSPRICRSRWLRGIRPGSSRKWRRPATRP